MIFENPGNTIGWTPETTEGIPIGNLVGIPYASSGGALNSRRTIAGHVAGDRCSEHLFVGFAGRVSAYGNNIGENCRPGAGTLFSAVPNVRTNLEA
jgi:hypothetical protein